MGFIADLQIHSRYAMACSKKTTLKLLEQYARIKGVDLLGVGDFQHPQWREEINAELTEDEYGILRSKTGFPFVWQTEVSLIYTQGGKGRRIHHLIYAPCKDVATQITTALGKKGRLDYDGRPIFGFSSIELVEMMRSISKDIEIVPAHAWTPWFSVFGSKSGFDSLKECFEDQAKHIHAIETGMSSDPAMNWRLSQLDGVQLISSSDAHSFWPWRLGREANIFEGDMTYETILKAIRTGKGLSSTIEVDPNYGKYHYDGHRNCGVVLDPKQPKPDGDLCPKCKKPLTVGVAYRIEELADREEGYKPEGAKDFKTAIPLTEIIAFALGGCGLATQKVWKMYNALIGAFGSEFKVLFEGDIGRIAELSHPMVAKIINASRVGTLKIEAGYDGVYGKITVEEGDVPPSSNQKSLGNFS